MNRKVVAGIMLAMISVGILTSPIQLLGASATIYIREGGSIDPDDGRIVTDDNINYHITEDIYDEILIERPDVILDGHNYSVEAYGKIHGLTIWPDNVTVKNVKIEGFQGFQYGIVLADSSGSNISHNIITNCSEAGILVQGGSANHVYMNNIKYSYDGIRCSYNTQKNNIYENNITGCSHSAIVFSETCHNRIFRNKISENPTGIESYGPVRSTDNRIYENIITGNNYGFRLSNASNNRIYGNNIANNRECGVFLFESSNNTVSKNNITDSDDGICLSGSSNNSMSGNQMKNNNFGIWLRDYSSHNSISENNITSNENGIWLRDYSSHNSISENNITANNVNGIGVSFYSNYNIISGNNIRDNFDGVGVGYDSSYNLIFENNITNNNNRGIGLGDAGNNIISGNNIIGNNRGIYLEAQSYDNSIYHNNLINNNQQSIIGWPYPSNVWDDGYPSGGNYWSDYNETDLNHDGIGDTPYVIDGDNTDFYPLMGMFSDFRVSWEDETHHVITVCNSMISDFQFNGTAIFFNVTGEIGIGFCRVCIPHSLMSPPYTVIIDGGLTPVLYANHTLFDNGTHRMIYFAYGNLPLEELLPIHPMADLNDDGVVDVSDLVALALAYGSYVGHPKYDPRADLNGDGVVDILDLVIWASIEALLMYRTEHEVIIRSQPDTIPPGVSILSPENKTYSVSDIPLTFVADEPTHWVGYSLDGQTNVTISGNTTLSDLEEGSHNVIVYANDTFGNMGSSERIFFTVAISPLEYTLVVHSSPGEVSFMVDDASHMTSWSGTYREGASVSLEMPEIHVVGETRYYWDRWSDGITNRSRTVIMDTNITLTAHYSGPYYELTVTSSPLTEVTFTINGTPQATPYTEWLLEASYTLEMPETYNGYIWSHWLEGGDTNRTKAVVMDKQIALTGVFAPVSPTATVNIHPETLNLKSKGRWINCYIELPEGYNVSDIDRATILLNDTIPVDQFWVDKPLESIGVTHLIVKFNRTAVSEFILSKGITHGNVTLTITLELYDGSSFEGSDVIRVVLPSHTKT